MYFIGDEELAALKKLFDSKKKLYRYHSDGPSECDSFETEFSETIGANHSLLLSSGTNSLIAALLAGGVQPGDEVLIPAYTFVATATAVLQVGAIPIVVNIDSELSLSLDEAANLVTSKTKALILVHMDGLVANVERAYAFCEKHSLIFIEDVAQALGASYQSKRLGTFGHFGCFSLNENKILSCGEGGILTTQQRSLFEKAFCIHDGPAQFNPTKKNFFTEIIPFAGSSMRVSEIQGAIMRVQLTRLSQILEGLRLRKTIFKETLGTLKNVEIIQGYDRQGECGSSLHLLAFDETTAAALGTALRAQGLPVMPVTARPAHAVWQWSPLFGTRAHIQEQRNPYRMTESSYQYSTGQYLESIQLLMRVLKMDINFHLSLEETQQQARRMREVVLSLR